MHLELDERTASAEAFMRRILRDDAPLAPEYPLVFDSRFDGRVVALQEGDAVRSACAILARDFVTPNGTITGGMIGSVVTDPEWRSNGLATRILVEAEAALQVDGCGFALLWAEEPGFYLRRGYGPVGREVDFVLSYDMVESLPAPTGVRAMTDADIDAVHALYTQHSVRLARTPDETRALLACPQMTRFVRERDGEVVAYSCMGRGKDLADAIHEWGGAGVDDVLALLRANLEHRFSTETAEDALAKSIAPDDDLRFLFFMAPPAARELCERLEDLGAPSSESMLGLAKILDRDVVAKCVDGLLGPRGTVEALDGATARGYSVRGPKGEALVDDEGMLAILLGVDAVSGDVASFFGELGLNDVALPLPVFAWGLDSI